MIRGVFDLFVGTYDVATDAEKCEAAADILLREGVTVISARTDGNGRYIFRVTCLAWRRLAPLFEHEGVKCEVSPPRGLPRGIKFLIGRPGIAVGIVLSLAVMWLSGRVVWSFEISGNGDVPEDRILYVLEDLGFTYGTYIPSVDFDCLHADFLAREHDIAWIAVNMKGNHARIELREARHGKHEEHSEGVYANLIASEDAEIAMTKVIAGKQEVQPGCIVRAGDLLVSGVIPLGVEGDGARYEYAEGEILAYVTRTAEVKIPFESEKKVYTGRCERHNKLKIFKKSMNLFINGGIEYASYDKIIENEQLWLFGIMPLPVWSVGECFREYEYVRTTSDYREVFSSAMRELREVTDELLGDSEMVSKKLTYELADDAYTVTCEMTCITDIAEISEFTVDAAESPAADD